MAKTRINYYSSNRGQATIEAVLLIFILFSVFFFSIKQMRDKQVLQKFTNDSLKPVKNMSEYGSWRETCKPAKGSGSARAAKCHPNSIGRSLSSDPK